jgi:hypothetical protein
MVRLESEECARQNRAYRATHPELEEEFREQDRQFEAFLNRKPAA